MTSPLRFDPSGHTTADARHPSDIVQSANVIWYSLIGLRKLRRSNFNLD